MILLSLGAHREPLAGQIHTLQGLPHDAVPVRRRIRLPLCDDTVPAVANVAPSFRVRVAGADRRPRRRTGRRRAGSVGKEAGGGRGVVEEATQFGAASRETVIDWRRIDRVQHSPRRSVAALQCSAIGRLRRHGSAHHAPQALHVASFVHYSRSFGLQKGTYLP